MLMIPFSFLFIVYFRTQTSRNYARNSHRRRGVTAPRWYSNPTASTQSSRICPRDITVSTPLRCSNSRRRTTGLPFRTPDRRELPVEEHASTWVTPLFSIKHCRVDHTQCIILPRPHTTDARKDRTPCATFIRPKSEPPLQFRIR
jgi:hypothetical protein